MESKNKYLLEDLILLIFIRLPVKYLLRIRCVCKSWNEIISSKSFRYFHLNYKKSLLNTQKYLLFDQYSIYSANLVDTESCVEIESNSVGRYRAPLFGINLGRCRHNGLKVHGICDGLLCLSDGEFLNSIRLWNPIARRVKIVPTHDHGFGTPGLVFGYHDDDYKVIKIARFREIYEVYVYSLSTDEWKFYRIDVPDNIRRSNYNYYDTYHQYPYAYLVNGVAYFVKVKPLQVLCLDLGCEIIRAVNFPKTMKPNTTFRIKVDGESIALVEFCSHIYSNDTDVVVYILTHSGRGEFTWEKKYSFELKNCSALGFIDDSKLMVTANKLNRLFMFFNLETKQFTEFKFQQRFRTSEERKNASSIYSFVESLVLLDETMDPYGSAKTTAFILEKYV